MSMKLLGNKLGQPSKSPLQRFLKGFRKEALTNWQLYLLMVLPFAYIIIFNYIPIYGIQIAFKRFTPSLGIWGSPWVGFENFLRFFDTYYFERVITNTVIIGTYSLVAGFPFSILLALALNTTQYARFRKAVQMITYAPFFISTVVMVGMINQLLSTQFGIVNQVIAALGLERISFFSNPSYFPHIYVWSGIWQGAGWGTIIYLAALSSVDGQLHEAAIVDGASVLQRILHIDIPGILPTITIVMILSFGGIFSVGFEKVYLMQNPLNLQTSEVISTYIYKVGLFSKLPDYSYATAVGLFNTIICFLMLVIVNSITKRLTSNSLW